MVKVTLEHPKLLSNGSNRSRTNIDIGMSSDNNDQIKEKVYMPSSDSKREGEEDDAYLPS